MLIIACEEKSSSLCRVSNIKIQTAINKQPTNQRITNKRQRQKTNVCGQPLRRLPECLLTTECSTTRTAFDAG